MGSNGGVLSFSRRALTVGLAAALASCTKSEHGLHGMDRVFSGFTFVGVFPVQDVALESHPHNATALPAILVPGPQYVFHLDADRDFEEISTRLLPDRLRSVEATILYAPKSWGEMAIPNTGNPVWQVEFAQNAYRGLIRNRLEMKRLERFADTEKFRRNLPEPRIDDYILTFAPSR